MVVPQYMVAQWDSRTTHLPGYTYHLPPIGTWGGEGRGGEGRGGEGRGGEGRGGEGRGGEGRGGEGRGGEGRGGEGRGGRGGEGRGREGKGGEGRGGEGRRGMKERGKVSVLGNAIPRGDTVSGTLWTSCWLEWWPQEVREGSTGAVQVLGRTEVKLRSITNHSTNGNTMPNTLHTTTTISQHQQ